LKFYARRTIHIAGYSDAGFFSTLQILPLTIEKNGYCVNRRDIFESHPSEQHQENCTVPLEQR
jgi:hypothetical protein